MKLALRLGSVRFSFSFWFFAVVAVFALLDRQALLVYIALPAAAHELGHLLCMAVCGVKAWEIRFTGVSVDIMTRSGRLSYRRELAVAAAGSVANLLAAFLLWRFSFQSMRAMLMTASHLAAAFFNLLPVGNLDGGQIMEILLSGFFAPSLAERISQVVSFLVLVPLSALAVWLLLRREGNFTLAAACLYLIATVILKGSKG